MNPINPLLVFMFSSLAQAAWGVQMREPDDDHPEPWLPAFVTASWPPDTVEGPQHPSNLPGADPNKSYKPTFDPMGWEEMETPPMGTPLSADNDSTNDSDEYQE